MQRRLVHSFLLAQSENEHEELRSCAACQDSTRRRRASGPGPAPTFAAAYSLLRSPAPRAEAPQGRPYDSCGRRRAPPARFRPAPRPPPCVIHSSWFRRAGHPRKEVGERWPARRLGGSWSRSMTWSKASSTATGARGSDSCHDLRHSYATWGRRPGIKAETMGDQLHASVVLTLDVYSHARIGEADAEALHAAFLRVGLPVDPAGLCRRGAGGHRQGGRASLSDGGEPEAGRPLGAGSAGAPGGAAGLAGSGRARTRRGDACGCRRSSRRGPSVCSSRRTAPAKRRCWSATPGRRQAAEPGFWNPNWNPKRVASVRKLLTTLVSRLGLEPRTLCLKGRCSTA